jgi:hypothetical protein
MRTELSRLIAALVFTLVLAGCDFDLPKANNGRVAVYHRPPVGNSVIVRPLSPQQVEDIAGWFTKHKTGWMHRITDLAPEAIVTLRRDGVIVAGINIGPSFVYANNWLKELNSSEHREIMLIVDPFSELPNQLPDPASPSVTPPAGARGAPSVAADH